MRIYRFGLVSLSIFLLALILASPAAATPEAVSMDVYIAMVLENNATLRSQEKSVEAAYFGVLSSVAYQRPSLALSVGGSYLSGEEQFGVKDHNITAYNVGAALLQQLDISGRFGLDEQQQILYYETQRAAYEDGVNSLVSNAREAYYSTLYARENIALQKDILKQREENLRVTTAMYREGTVPKLDVVRAESQVIEARSMITEAEMAYRNLLVAMAELSGGTPILVLDETLALPLPPYETSLEHAVLHRADIRAYALLRERARVVKRLKAKGLSPTLTAGVNWMPLADPWNASSPQKGEVTVGLTLNIPVFDGNATKYETLNADRLWQSAEASLKAAFDATVQQLATARNNLERATAIEEEKRQQIVVSDEEVRITRERYLGGVGAQLDLINALTLNQQVRTDHLSAVKDMYVALVELRRASGDYGWENGRKDWEDAVREYGHGDAKPAIDRKGDESDE